MSDCSHTCCWRLQQDTERRGRLTSKATRGSTVNTSSNQNATEQPAQTAFYAGFPDFEVEVVPLKVRKDDKKFRLQGENAAKARAKWNSTPPARANTAWNNIRVLQKFGGLKLKPNKSEGDNDDFDPMTGSPLHGPPGESDRQIVARAAQP